MKYIITLLVIFLIGTSIYIYVNGNTESDIVQDDVQNNDIDEISDSAILEPNNKQIFTLGDSLTAGYGLDLAEGYPAQLESKLQQEGYIYEVINAGVSGDTSRGLLARTDRNTDGANPGDIALVVIGANDGMRSLSLVELEKNISSIVELLQTKEITVILGGMMIPTNLAPEYRSDFEAIYPRIAQLYDIPLIPFFLEGVAGDPSLNLPDGIHPTQQGYSIIVDNVYDFMQQEGLLDDE